MAGPKHEKTKKSPAKKHISRPVKRRTSGMDREDGPRVPDQQKLDCTRPGRACSDKNRRGIVFFEKVKKAPIELAKEFYWCDERSFYEMQVPLEDAKAFALASFSFLDANPEIHNFLPRVRRAQLAARQYCAWLIAAAKMGT